MARLRGYVPLDKVVAAAKKTIRSLLSEGDRRSVGRVAEVVELVRRHPKQIARVVELLWDRDACICMRAADALEKMSREQPGLLQAYKTPLLALSAETAQQEVKWHLALTIPRLQLTICECRSAAEVLQTYLEDRSSIVKTFAMQGLADLTRQDATLRPMVMELLRRLARTGTPAMRARGRILLEQLEAG